MRELLDGGPAAEVGLRADGTRTTPVDGPRAGGRRATAARIGRTPSSWPPAARAGVTAAALLDLASDAPAAPGAARPHRARRRTRGPGGGDRRGRARSGPARRAPAGATPRRDRGAGPGGSWPPARSEPRWRRWRPPDRRRYVAVDVRDGERSPPRAGRGAPGLGAGHRDRARRRRARGQADRREDRRAVRPRPGHQGRTVCAPCSPRPRTTRSTHRPVLLGRRRVSATPDRATTPWPTRCSTRSPAPSGPGGPAAWCGAIAWGPVARRDGHTGAGRALRPGRGAARSPPPGRRRLHRRAGRSGRRHRVVLSRPGTAPARPKPSPIRPRRGAIDAADACPPRRPRDRRRARAARGRGPGLVRGRRRGLAAGVGSLCCATCGSSARSPFRLGGAGTGSPCSGRRRAAGPRSAVEAELAGRRATALPGAAGRRGGPAAPGALGHSRRAPAPNGHRASTTAGSCSTAPGSTPLTPSTVFGAAGAEAIVAGGVSELGWAATTGSSIRPPSTVRLQLALLWARRRRSVTHPADGGRGVPWCTGGAPSRAPVRAWCGPGRCTSTGARCDVALLGADGSSCGGAARRGARRARPS